MEITAPDAQALRGLVGQFVVVSFSTGAVVGAGGMTKLTSVYGDRVTLTTKAQPRQASISLIERVGVVAILPARKGRDADIGFDAKVGA